MIDNFADPSAVAAASASIPDADWPHWVRYANDVEQGKRTCKELGLLPRPLADLLAWLRSPAAEGKLQQVIRPPYLEHDPTLHGAGLHITEPGGWLQVHADYERHPKMDLFQRGWSLILGLNPTWDSTQGGALLLCDGAGRRRQVIYPTFNRAIIFENGPASFHGVEQVKGSQARATLAMYYVKPIQPDAHRLRAMFLPNRDGGQCPREVR